jgi:hypothetical protein
MKLKIKFNSIATLIGMICTITINSGCKIENENILLVNADSAAIYQGLDFLSDEDNKFIESISVPASPSDSLIFNVFDEKKSTNNDYLVKKLVLYANELCLQKDGETQKCYNEADPNHCGLAYSFGQKNHTIRAIPPYWPVNPDNTIQVNEDGGSVISKEQKKGLELHRKYSVYGLDCSGLMVTLLKKEGININSETTYTGNFEDNLKNAVKKSNYKLLVVQNKHNLSKDSLKQGDFILWKEKGHIGIIFIKKGNPIKVCQSNGLPYSTDVDEQINNYSSIKRGVHTFNFDGMIQNDGINWGKSYEIIRIVEPWQLEKKKNDNGDNQSGLPGEQLRKPIKVTVLDNNKDSMSNIKVNFTANNGGSVSQNQVTTGDDGTAEVTWTLGPTDNTQTVTVTAFKGDNTTPLFASPLTFTATASKIKFISPANGAVFHIPHGSSSGTFHVTFTWSGPGHLLRLAQDGLGYYAYEVDNNEFSMDFGISTWYWNVTSSIDEVPLENYIFSVVYDY